MTQLFRLQSKPAIATRPGIRCVVCEADEWRHVGNGYDYEYETCGNEWSYKACLTCGHVQIDPLPTDDALSVIYPPHYYSYLIKDIVPPIALWAKGLLDRVKFRGILAQLKLFPQSYLDIGCGDARYLELMISQGVLRQNAFGIELDEKAVELAASNHLNVWQCRIEDASHLPVAGLDLITMFHVVEHVARPDEVMKKLHSLLAPEGVLALETPNFDCFDARLAQRRFWGGYHIPRHWHIFTPKSIARLLEASGYRVLSIRYQSGHAFWLWTLHHYLKYGKEMPRLAAFCHPLRNVPLLTLVTAFDILRARFGAKTSAMLVLAAKA